MKKLLASVCTVAAILSCVSSAQASFIDDLILGKISASHDYGSNRDSDKEPAAQNNQDESNAFVDFLASLEPRWIKDLFPG